MDVLNSLMAPLGPHEVVFLCVRLGQIALTIFAAVQVVRYGITCLARAYEAILVMLVVLVFLSIGNLILHDTDSRAPDIVEWGWLMFDVAVAFLVLRYISEQRKFSVRLQRVLLRKGETPQ